MAGSARKSLALALEALVGESDEAEDFALGCLIDAWSTTHSPRIAALVDTLGGRLEALVPAKLTGKRSELHPKWMAIADRSNPVDWPRLLRNVILTADRFGVAAANDLTERMIAIQQTRKPDPRTAAIVVELLRRPGYESSSSSTYAFWQDLIAILTDDLDPRAADMLRTLNHGNIFRPYSDRKRAAVWFASEVSSALEMLARDVKPPAALDKPCAELCSKLEAALKKSRSIDPRLVEYFKTDPDPDAPEPAPKAAAPKLDSSSADRKLAAAATALSAGDAHAALAALLDAWRACRAPAIADLVDRVSARVSASLAPIDATSRKAIHDLWLRTAHEKDPADFPRLLASVMHTFGRSTDALERAVVLVSWPPDSRATQLVELLEKPPFHTSSTKPFWTAVFELAVHHGDSRMIDALDGLTGKFVRILRSDYASRSAMTRWFEQKLVTTLTELRARFPSVPLGDAKACARIAAELDRTANTTDALIAEIAAAPDDDGPRQVYADHLLERGDPRGEFITLQLAARKNPKREAALLAKHRHGWLGPLAGCADHELSRFERGFLVDVRLRGHDLADSVGDPIWSTVRSLDLAQIRALPGDLLRHPAARSLVHLGGLTRNAMLELLSWSAIPYSSINGAFPSARNRVHRAADIAAITRAKPALAKLRVLELDGSTMAPPEFRWLWTSWLGQQLECAGFEHTLFKLVAWHAELAAHATTIPRLKLAFEEFWLGWLELSRDATGKLTLADVYSEEPSYRRFWESCGHVARQLRNLPRGSLSRLRVHGGSPTATQKRLLETACRRAGIELELPRKA